ncbi:hypothetical protein CAPTEDRAFT_222677 [Capitella teleta]|uniref:Uncharacterized protein n=1 Tax=Capitella teleta TaxID=283909 RepID=R7TPU3_CAPTE|nr:hypothetical protein CAPTEDRAFT_222677 [Capitella teleta]|eukprot:ELT95679.1 hypothetical protein CAPTEDRAFT_222677 [Capitella teleta]
MKLSKHLKSGLLVAISLLVVIETWNAWTVRGGAAVPVTVLNVEYKRRVIEVNSQFGRNLTEVDVIRAGISRAVGIMNVTSKVVLPVANPPSLMHSYLKNKLPHDREEERNVSSRSGVAGVMPAREGHPSVHSVKGRQ